MKTILILILSFTSIFSQLQNTAETLKKGDAVVRLNGAIYDSDFQFNAHGGYGIARGMDLEVRLGFGVGKTYFGADLEYLLSSKSSNDMSISAGFHTWNNFGIDLTGTFSTEITRKLNLFVAADFDFEFIDEGNSSSMEVFPYLILGFDLPLKKNIALDFEGDIGLGNNAPNKIVLGMNYYL